MWPSSTTSPGASTARGVSAPLTMQPFFESRSSSIQPPPRRVMPGVLARHPAVGDPEVEAALGRDPGDLARAAPDRDQVDVVEDVARRRGQRLVALDRAQQHRARPRRVVHRRASPEADAAERVVAHGARRIPPRVLRSQVREARDAFLARNHLHRGALEVVAPTAGRGRPGGPPGTPRRPRRTPGCSPAGRSRGPRRGTARRSPGCSLACIALTIWSDSACVDPRVVGALADQQRPLDRVDVGERRARR